MVFRKIIIIAALALPLAGAADINRPDGAGYVERASEMFADENFIGCIDQSSTALDLPLSDDARRQALLLRGRAMVHTDRAAAQLELAAWLDTYPAAPERNIARMALADCYYGTDYRRALKLYSEVDPTNLAPELADDLHFRLGYCYIVTGKYTRARAQMAKLSDSRRYADTARFYLGYINYCQQDFKAAEQMFASVDRSAAPGNLADYYLAQIYFWQKDYSKALSTARDVIKAGAAPAEYIAEACRIAGESEFNLHHMTSAVDYLKRYVAHTANPQPSALYILGVNAYETGNYQRAAELLAPAAEVADAMGQSALLYIGLSEIQMRDYDAAVMAFDSALKIDANTAVGELAYYNYAVASMRGGKVPFGSSVATFRKFLDDYPDSKYAPQVQEFVISSYLTDSNFAEALAAIEQMRNPSAATLAAKQQVLYSLGVAALSQNDTKAALDYLQQATALATHNAQIAAEVSLSLGEVYYRDGKYDAAADCLESYISRDAKNAVNLPLAYYDLGYTRFAMKDYAAAAKAFDRAVATAPADAPYLLDALNRLGDSDYYCRDFKGAASAYDRAFNLAPDSGDYPLFQQGIMEGYQRHYRAKIDILADLMKRFPSSPLIPDALLETTEAYIQLGDNASAVDTYRRLVDMYPGTVQGRQGYLQMALLLMNTGDRPGAIDAYKQVVVQYPSSDEAKQATDALKRIYAADGRLADFMAFIDTVTDAPKMDAAEADRLSFDAAEDDYLTIGAIDKLRQYVESFPTGAYRAQALFYLIDGEVADGNLTAAIDYAAALIAEFPDNSGVEHALAVKAGIETDLGRGNAAMRSWQMLADKASKPESLARARIGIMRTGLQIEDYDAALAAADLLLASTATDAAIRAEATYSRGVALAGRGDADAARQAWSSVATSTGDYYGAASAFALANSLFESGLAADAEAAADRLISSGSPQAYWIARAFILLSDIYAAEGNTFKSQQYLKALRDNYPGSEPDIIQAIDQRLSK